MFREACSIYKRCLCHVGGCNAGGSSKSHGSACLISPRLLVTAHHVVEDSLQRYDWVSVLKHDGLFRCEVLTSDDKFDIALLETVEQIRQADLTAPSTYPTIAHILPELGMTVGYMSRFCRRDKETGEHYGSTFFSIGSVSFMRPDPNRWVLSSGFVEEGFSGSPAFLADGTLIGLITDSLQATAILDCLESQLHTFPCLSPIVFFNERIINANRTRT